MFAVPLPRVHDAASLQASTELLSALRMSHHREEYDRSMTSTAWPPLPLEVWKPTYETLHLWMQIVGKITLALTPFPITSGTVPSR